MINENLSLKYKKKAKQFKQTPPCVPSVKYIKLGRKRVYQFTAVDLAARYSWREIYEDKTPYSALSFLKYVLKTSPFKIQAIQTATEGSACGCEGGKKLNKIKTFITKYNFLDILKN